MNALVVSCHSPGISAPRALGLGRHFLLAEDGAPGRVRFLGLQVELAEGATSSWVTVTRTGSFTDPRYGRFEITDAMLRQMVSNFEAKVFGQDVFIDVNHKPGDGAAGKVARLAVEGGKLRALVEWTPFGVDAIKGRGFAYLSAEFHEDWHDNQQGDAHGCVLLGAGLTVRPVIKHLDPVQLSAAEGDDDNGHRTAVHPQLIKSLESSTMNHLDKLKAKLLAQGLTLEQITPLLAEAEKQLSAAGNDEAKCLGLVDSWEATGKALAEQIKKLGTGASGPIQLAVTHGVSAADVAAQVAKVLAEREATETASRTARAAKVKLLSDTIDADTALNEDSRKKLAAEAGAMLTDGMTDDQVKRLAEFMLTQARSASAAVQLATLGFRPASGNVHIEVGQPGEIKALQEQVDRRLGLAGMPAALRYARTNGVLLDHNKALAEKALAFFDQTHGARLMAEHKMLSGGMTGISDVAVPMVYERTVLREMLYQLLGASFCDVGTYTFSNVVNIFYSYRDTTGAGINDTRTYELQPIKSASIKEAMEEARPIPQKLAYQISNEIRYLLAAAPIDYDPLTENTKNIIRIVGEDTDRIIHNELLNAADEYLCTTFTDTLTAQVNGANGVFVLTNWPVVRPRRIYDLQGNQVGVTQNPVVVTLGGTARSEYVSGVALSAGTYYVLDYNLGELRFVTENGVPVIPNNATALTLSGSRATNVAKVDLYPGTATPTLLQTQTVYDAMLLLLGARKVAIENDRYYAANMLLMSGAVDNALSQATTFQANSSRVGTGLAADGSVGQVKGMPNYNTKAPGLNMGDVRTLIGERGNTRFRMLKPFSMQPNMDQSKDSNGRFLGAQGNYGEQYIACHTPTQRKGAITSTVQFNSAARVARVS